MKREIDYYLDKAIDLLACEPIIGKQVHTAADVYPLLKPYGLKRQEHFVVVTLSGAHQIIRIECVSKGIINKTIVHSREVFRRAIISNAAAVIIAHNHPSGQMVPSDEDRAITKRLVEAGEIIGISVLDHLIITRIGYMSFIEQGIPM